MHRQKLPADNPEIAIGIWSDGTSTVIPRFTVKWNEFAFYISIFLWQACDCGELNQGMFVRWSSSYPTWLIQALLKVYWETRVLLSPILGRDGIYGLETNGMEERLVISVVWSGSFFEGLLRRRIDFWMPRFQSAGWDWLTNCRWFRHTMQRVWTCLTFCAENNWGLSVQSL